jgi:hypothetical protein
MVSGNTLDECAVSVQFQRLDLTYPDGDNTIVQDTIIPALNQVLYNFTKPIPIGIRHIHFEVEAGDSTVIDQFLYINNGPNTTKNLRDPDACI